jgi:hypothetical protein
VVLVSHSRKAQGSDWKPVEQRVPITWTARHLEGFRCLTIELHETEIEFLIQKGLLQSVTRNDLDAVRQALYSYLDETMG